MEKTTYSTLPSSIHAKPVPDRGSQLQGRANLGSIGTPRNLSEFSEQGFKIMVLMSLLITL